MKLKDVLHSKRGFRGLVAVFCLMFMLIGLIPVTGQQNKVTAYAETGGVTDFVSRLYTEVLGREADEAGLAAWAELLLNGSYTGAEVASGFIMSNEFINKEMDHEEFVQIMYRAFFGRDAEPEGLAGWVDLLEQGYRKSYIFKGFANSNEFGALCDSYGVEAGLIPVTVSEQQANLSDEDYNIWQFVERMYTEVLKRSADMVGIKGWVDVLKDGTWSGSEVASGFILSDEFQATEMTDEEYVRIMYKAFFGRAADDASLTIWVNGLETGEYTKEFIFAGFANSTEFGVLCDNYGITQGEVEIPEDETGEVEFSVYAESGVEIHSADAGVIITKKDGYYGAVNYVGDTIVPHKYVDVWHRVNSDGMFALENANEEIIIFNANGKKLHTMETFTVVENNRTVDLEYIYISEGVLTSVYKGKTWQGDYAEVYDLSEGKLLAEHWISMGITPMKDGVYYTSPYPCLYKVDKNGESTMLYANYKNYIADPSGEVAFAYAPRGEYGVFYLMNWYEGLRVGLLSTDGTEVSLIAYQDLEELFGVESASSVSVPWTWDDGVRYGNMDQQIVVSVVNEDGIRSKEALLDFSKAEYAEFDVYNYANEVETTEVRVSNLLDIVVAQYDSISLNGSGNYLVEEGEDEFYINAQGEKVADYVKCSSFYNGYAAVIKEDGMVYLVDESFNETETDYVANNVRNGGSAFVLETEEGEILLLVNDDAPIRQPEKADFVDYYAEGVEIISVGQEVILTYKDGYYGAVDYDGNQLVAYEYPSVGTRINDDGMFALINDNNEAVIFGPDGTELYRLPASMEDESIGKIYLCVLQISEGVVTYAYGDWMECCVGAYNLETGVKFYEEYTWFTRGRVTAMKDGVFYYSSGYKLYAVDSDGWDWVVYDNSEFGLADPGGEVRYVAAPNGDYGFVYVQNDYEGIRLGVLNKNNGESALMTYSDLEAALGVENTYGCSVTSYWGDGIWYNVLNQQAVMYMYYEDDSTTKYALLDFSKAEFAEFDVCDYSGETVGTEVRISNPEELIVAQYDYIALSESGYYLAGNNDDWFYIDKNGEVVADYVDCAGFYNGYAAVIKEDGMVYLIDESFNETATGYAADNVHVSGEGFVMERDGAQKVLIVK